MILNFFSSLYYRLFALPCALIFGDTISISEIFAAVYIILPVLISWFDHLLILNEKRWQYHTDNAVYRF